MPWKPPEKYGKDRSNYTSTMMTTSLAIMSKKFSRDQKNLPYKINLTLPKEKQVDIKKNGNIIKTMNVRRRSKYLSSRSARYF